MAINPNTDFSSGAVLTAAQQNRFPRGIMAYNTSTASDTTITTEEVQITGSSFTAVANRYYRIIYFEPDIVQGTGYFTSTIRLTNISGTVLNRTYNVTGTGVDRQIINIWVGTLTAGTTNVVGTLAQSAGTGQAVRSSTNVAYLVVEDIGPA